MLDVFLDRINSVPTQELDLTFEFKSWLANLVDSLNSNLDDIEFVINYGSGQQYTQAQIIAMHAAVPNLIPDGAIFYDTTAKVYVGQQNGSLVKFTTTSYP